MRWQPVAAALVVVAVLILAGWAFVRTTPTRDVDRGASNHFSEADVPSANQNTGGNRDRASNSSDSGKPIGANGKPSATDLLKQYEQANKDLGKAKQPLKDLGGKLPEPPLLPEGSPEEIRKKVRENLENYNKRITDPAYQKDKIDGEHRRALRRASERSKDWLAGVAEAPETIEIEDADELRARFESDYLGVLDSFFAEKLGADDHASQAQILVALLDGLLRYSGTELWSPDDLRDRVQRALSGGGVWPLTAMSLSHSKRSLALPLNSNRAICLWATPKEIADRVVRWANEATSQVQASVLLQFVVVAAMDLGPSAVEDAGQTVLAALNMSIPRWAKAKQLAGASIVAAALEDFAAVLLCACAEPRLAECVDRMTSISVALAMAFAKEGDSASRSGVEAALVGMRLAVVRRVLRSRAENALGAASLDVGDGDLTQQDDAPSLAAAEFEQVGTLPSEWRSLALLYPVRRLMSGKLATTMGNTTRLTELLRAGKWTSEIESLLNQLGGAATPALAAVFTVEAGRDAAEVTLTGR